MSSYPPELSTNQLDFLRDTATDWALAHGLVVRPTADKQVHFSNHAAVIHAPFALYPTPFPRTEFEKAKGLQQAWNLLIHKMSQDDDLIHEIMQTLSNVDSFMDNLYQIYCKVRKEGVAQSASLGIHRCDYLLHTPQGASARTARIQQVEFNTVSASFGSLCSRTSELHKYLHVAVDNYANGMIKLNQLPDNRAIDALANGLACAWKVYGKPDARVLMIVQGGERNIFDQRWIEYNLLKVHGIRMMRRTMGEVHATATLDPTTKALIIDGHEIAVSYYRAAYGPEDFFGPEEWEARLTVERSASIKCPTVAYQLVGAKKVQQVLSVPGRLERYVDKYTADLLRESFAGLYPLDNSPEGIKAYQAAMENPEKYVLKPQREGGGHNFYGKEIVNVLNKLSEEERNAYILMDLIQSPPLQNLMVREGEIIKGDVISELGIYGIYVHDGENEVHNEIGGHLLRTKAHNTNEGGVAAGFAVIDSPLLID